MGIVYRAYDVKLRRSVAIKVIAPHLVEDEDARERFLVEAQALAGLSHPNIVTVFDLAEEAETGHVFIVMELLNGLPLRKHITDPARPPFYDMAAQVCRALEHAHSKGVLHRDIKPENIFVCDDGTVKLMDFGLARLVDGSTVNASGMVTGTVAYMSPEQLKGDVLDPRADLYALGVLFYEYLCGFTPFTSDSPGTMLLKHLTEAAPSLLHRVPGLSPDLDALILRLLSKSPGDRYPSAMILRDSLDHVRKQAPTTAAPIAAPKLAGPPMPATQVPLVAPRPLRPKATTTTVRTVSTPRRHVGRYVAVMCVILIGAILAFAFGETLQRMFAQNMEPAKKPAPAKKTATTKTHPTSSSGGRRVRKGRTGNRSATSDSGKPHVREASSSDSTTHAHTGAGNNAKDESQSEPQDTTSDTDPGTAPPDNKDGENNG